MKWYLPCLVDAPARYTAGVSAQFIDLLLTGLHVILDDEVNFQGQMLGLNQQALPAATNNSASQFSMPAVHREFAVRSLVVWDGMGCRSSSPEDPTLIIIAWISWPSARDNNDTAARRVGSDVLQNNNNAVIFAFAASALSRYPPIQRCDYDFPLHGAHGYGSQVPQPSGQEHAKSSPSRRDPFPIAPRSVSRPRRTKHRRIGMQQLCECIAQAIDY